MSSAAAVGVDVGATLTKIAMRSPGRSPRNGILYRLEPADDLAAVARRVDESGARRIGLTGAGAAALADRLAQPSIPVNEFAAWGVGARALLEQSGDLPGERYLLVSLGTGTSVMLADGMAVSRIGGTALGGGTLLGLGSALLGHTSFEKLAELASRGSRHSVDLLVSDIYRPGEIALAGGITAASFGKLARGDTKPAAEDVAHALMGLVGENVALICAGLGTAHQVRPIVYAGATLRGNPALVAILRLITSALGSAVTFLVDGEFAAALGALRLAEDSA